MIDITTTEDSLIDDQVDGFSAEMKTLSGLPPATGPMPLAMPADQLEEIDLFRSRNSIVSQHVSELARGLEHECDLTPVLVMRRGHRVFLIDGRHRKAAYELTGRGDGVPVEEFIGTTAEAVLEGQRRNRQHTLQMTHNERMDAAWKLVRLDASRQCRFTLTAIMANTGASRGQVTLMRRVLRELPDAVQHSQWLKALHAHQKKPERSYTEEEEEALIDAEAQRCADRMVRELGRRPADNAELMARILEYYTGRRLDEVIHVLIERNGSSEHGDFGNVDF